MATADVRWRRCGKSCARQYPAITFFFQTADIVGQILNFGLPAPIDIQVVGQNKAANFATARAIAAQVTRVPGAVDVHVHQVMNAPELLFNVDRAARAGNGADAARRRQRPARELSSSGVVTPELLAQSGERRELSVAVQTPQTQAQHDGCAAEHADHRRRAGPELLSNVATMQRRSQMAVVNHYNVQPVFDVYANVQGRDLGGVAARHRQDRRPRAKPKLREGQLDRHARPGAEHAVVVPRPGRRARVRRFCSSTC